MKITRPRLVVGTVIASAAAVLIPSAAAVAFISPPLVMLAEAQSPARLVAGGAAVDVTVEYSCTADGMSLAVQVTEKVGKGIASGTGYTNVPCDGATHQVVVRAAANAAGRAFAAGSAATQTDVSGCRFRSGHGFCGQDSIQRTIKIKK